MTRCKWSQMSSLDDVRQELDRLFEDYVAGFCPSSLIRGLRFPAVNLWEDAGTIVLQAEAAGLRMEDIEVYVVGNMLTIKGHRPPLAAGEVTVHRQELAAGPFERRIKLPVEADAGRIEATLKDGLLTITIAKPTVSAATRIAVKG